MSGKSYILETLRNSLNWIIEHKFKENELLDVPNPLISQMMVTSYERFNPKSITKEEL